MPDCGPTPDLIRIIRRGEPRKNAYFSAEAMKNAKPDTILTHAGCNPGTNHGIVNPPVYHASTVLFPTVEALEDAGHSFDGVRYGRIGTPTSQAFETAIAELEGGYKAVAAAVRPCGDHDSAAGLRVSRRPHPRKRQRLWAEPPLLHRYVEADGCRDGILRSADRRRDRAADASNTRVVFLESPGSLTFEIQDVPAIAAVAKNAGAVAMIDNTWATPLFFRPFDHGVDLSIHAATKYIVGHSDAMLGVITARTPELWNRLKRYAVQLGTCAGPDDIYLGLRGLRTHGHPAEAASGDRHGTGALAPKPAGGDAHPSSRLARRSWPCAVAARFPGRQRACSRWS